jgi:prepilin-type N-terminal cleavage/methylation domain-containing protein
MKTASAPRRRQFFTLIELMVVLIIIAVLAGIGVAVGQRTLANSHKKATAMFIRTLLTGCEKFKAEYGAYPLEREDGNAQSRNTRWQKPAPHVGTFTDNYTDTADQRQGIVGATKTSTNGTSLVWSLTKPSRADGTTRPENHPQYWGDEYLKSDDISGRYFSHPTDTDLDLVRTGVFLDDWRNQDAPLVYWLRYRDDATDAIISNTTATLKDKLTPEIWSFGADGKATATATENCLRLSQYPDLSSCRANHPIDTDNVGGDLNKMKE